MKILPSEIQEIELQLMDAIKSSNVKFLEKILHEDLVFLLPTGQILSKKMDLDSHQSGNMVVEKINPTIEDLKIYDDIAIIVLIYETKGTMFGNPIEGFFRYIRTWKKFEDGLKIIAGACIRLPTP